MNDEDGDRDLADSLAPFPRAGSGAGSEEEPPLNRAADCPAGLDSHWWQAFVHARDAKLKMEAQVRAETRTLRRLQRHLHKLSGEDDELRNAIEAKARELEAFRSAKDLSNLDLEIPVKLRQGQLETEPHKDTVCDMGHAVLLDRKRVENINSIIQRKGGKKVSILTAIKDFKKGSYMLEWTNAKLDREGEDLVEKTRELQLLRVTKSLQEALKRGGELQSSPQEQVMGRLMRPPLPVGRAALGRLPGSPSAP